MTKMFKKKQNFNLKWYHTNKNTTLTHNSRNESNKWINKTLTRYTKLKIRLQDFR